MVFCVSKLLATLSGGAIATVGLITSVIEYFSLLSLSAGNLFGIAPAFSYSPNAKCANIHICDTTSACLFGVVAPVLLDLSLATSVPTMKSLLVLRKSLHIEQVLLFLLHSPLMVIFTLFDTPAQRLVLAVLLIQ